MEEIVIDKVYENVKPFLSEQNHIKKVTKDSRNAVQNSLASSGLSPIEHSRVMQIIQTLK